MDTKPQLETALKDAMRSNNEVAKRALRMALSNIKLAEIENRSPLDENAVQSILQKEIKSRNETILDAQKANRPDLAADTQAEIEVLSQYLPKQLSQEELSQIVAAVIQEVGAANPADMGKVMKVLLPRLQGRAPGNVVNQIVKQALAGE